MAVLDQTDIIDEFLDFDGTRGKWNAHLGTAKHPLGALGNDPLSFGNTLVKAHFQFACYILDVLGEINTIFQEKYSFVPIFGNFSGLLASF